MTLVEKSKLVTELLELVESRTGGPYEVEEVLHAAYNTLPSEVRKQI